MRLRRTIVAWSIRSAGAGPFRVVPPLRLAALFLAATLVSACGGGGGGSGSRASTGETGPDVGTSCIETQMFGCLEGKKWGLSRVRTERAWARLEQE